MKKFRLTKLGKAIQKGLTIFLVLILVINVGRSVNAEEQIGIAFKGFNNENLLDITKDWPSFQNAIFVGSEIAAGSPIEQFEAAAIIDVSSINTSIDYGNLKLNFSIGAYISSLETDDSAQVLIDFRKTSSVSETPISTLALTRTNSEYDNFIPLVFTDTIPVETRYIFIHLKGVTTTVNNSVKFNSPTFKIMDGNNPTITSNLASNWTKSDVTVTLTAADSESGIEGIYDADTNQKVSSTSTYNYTIQSNNVRNFYAVDFSSRVSDPLNVTVSNIDKNSPTTAPIISLNPTTWTNQALTFTLANNSATQNESPEKRQYKLNNGEWTDYNGTVTITFEGLSTVCSRVIDEALNTSPETCLNAYYDKTGPQISNKTIVPISSGGATITITASDVNSGILIKKWAMGTQNATYFASSGNVFTGTNFTTSTGGIVSIYLKDNAGNVTIDTFTINTFPTISTLSNVSMDENTTKPYTFTVSDYESTSDKLLINITSNNTNVIPNPIFTNTNGTINFDISPIAYKYGNVTFTIKVTDEALNVTTKTFTINVLNVNDKPVAVNDSYATTEDASITLTPLSNDNDPDNNTLFIESVSTPNLGTAVISGDKKSILYTPASGKNGEDNFSYTVKDSNLVSDAAIITITVSEANDAPIANNDNYIIQEDEVKEMNVLENDVDEDLNTTTDEKLTIEILTSPSRGVVNITNGMLSYKPTENWFGTDQFTYSITDRGNLVSSATVNIVVNSVNDAPQFLDITDSYTIDEDSSKQTITFKIDDVETDTESLMLQVVSSNESIIPTSSIEIIGMGTSEGTIQVSYTPNAEKSGNAGLTLRIGDGFLITQHDISIMVTAINDLPIAVDDVYSYVEDNNELIIDMKDLVLNDTDIDNPTLTFAGIETAVNFGELTLISGTQYAYTPKPDYAGDVYFEYLVSDGINTDIGKVDIKGTAVNDRPTITQLTQSLTFNEDSKDNLIKFKIEDLESSVNQLIVSFGTENSSLVSISNISFTLNVQNEIEVLVSPSLDQFGTVKLTMTVSDGELYAVKDFTLTFESVQDKPVAINDVIYVPKNSTTLVDVLSNDYDVDLDTFTLEQVSIIDNVTIGNISIENQKIKYTIGNSYVGPDSFTYTIKDEFNNSTTGTVNVAVGGYSFPSQISQIAHQFILEDTSTADLPFTLSDLDVNETWTVSLSSSNTNLINVESMVLSSTNNSKPYKLKITPVANQNGTSIVTVSVTDSQDNITTSSFNITVYAVDDAPNANTDSISLDEDKSLNFNVLSNDTDSDTISSKLKTISATRPTHGLLSGTNGQYTYIPFPNFNGIDSFTYLLSDGTSIVEATVNITVNPINDAPYVYTHYLTLPNATNETITFNFLTNVRDVDGDTSFYIDTTVLTNANYGSVNILANGNVTYTRSQISPNTNGSDSFQVRVYDRDTGGLAGIGTVYIATHYTSSLYANGVSVSHFEDDEAFWIDLPISNPNSDVLTITSATPNKGTIIEIDSTNKKIKYQPTLNAFGSDNFTYTVTNSNNITSNGTVYVTLYPVNDAPIFDRILSKISVNEDELSTSQTIKISDIENDDLLFNIIVNNPNPSKPIITNEGIEIIRNGNDISFTLQSVKNAYGDLSITLQVSDGLAQTTQTIDVSVNPVNDAPTASTISVSLPEDTQIDFDVINVNSDVDNDTLTLSLLTQPEHGISIVNLNNTLTYTPNLNYYGTDTFTVTLDDGKGGTAVSTVNINVINVNDAPVISQLGSRYVLNEDGNLEILFNIIDLDYDSITNTLSEYSDSLFGTNGILVTKVTGNQYKLTITPKSNAFGTQNVKLNVTDELETVTHVFDILVVSINDLPIAGNNEFTIEEDASSTLNVLGNDSDVEDTTLRIIGVSSSNVGSQINVSSNGTLSYIPKPNYNGEDTFTYTISDSNNGQATATVTVNITAVNDAPKLVNDSAITDEDVAIEIPVLGNDSDVEGQALLITDVSNGTLAKSIVINPEDISEIIYTPKDNIWGIDTFTYTVSDGTTTTSATVNVTIRSLNDAPVVVKNSLTNGDWIFNEDTIGVFKFDVSDVETSSGNLIVTMTSSNSTLIPNTSIVYTGSSSTKTVSLTPTPQLFGNTDLSITVSDGVLSTTVVYPVTVLAVNDQPTLKVIDINTEEDTSSTKTAIATDIENNTLVYSVKTNPNHGTVNLVNGVYTYIPSLNYNGLDSFEIQVNDGQSENSTTYKTVNVTVTPVNDAPKANNDLEYFVNEDGSIDLEVLSNDDDVDLYDSGSSENLRVTSKSNSTNATITIIEDGKKLHFVPNANYNGTVNFTYTITDIGGLTSTANVQVLVKPINDKPVNGNDSYEIYEDDLPKTFNVLSNDDIDIGDTLTLLSIVTQGTLGEANIENNKIVYTPYSNKFGNDSFTYKMKDLDGNEVDFVTSIKINSVNDLPTISTISNQVINEDSNTIPIEFIINDIEDLSSLLNISVASNNTAIIPISNIVIGNLVGNTRTVQVTPILDKVSDNVKVTLTVTDKNSGTASTDFYVKINGINDVPVAQADSGFDTDENTPITIDILANDDIDVLANNGGDLLSIVSVAENGTSYGKTEIIFNSTKNRDELRFTPNKDWNSSVAHIQVFDYVMKDATNNQSSSQVSITINPVNDVPNISKPANATINEDTSLSDHIFTVLDEEDSEDALVISATSSNQLIIQNSKITVTNPVEGEANLRYISLNPELNTNGKVTITLVVKDQSGSGLSATQTFDVTVNPVNDGPINGNDTYTIKEDIVSTFDVLSNDDLDSSIEGDTLTIVSVTQPSYGNADILDNKIVYTPQLNFSSLVSNIDTFKYSMIDAGLVTVEFTVSVTITPVNDVPIIDPITDKTTGETQPITFDFTLSDVDNDDSLISITSSSDNTVLFPNNSANILIENLGDSNRRMTLTPNGKWNGNSNITLTANDGINDSLPIKFKITVSEVNDRPVAYDDLSYSFLEDGTYNLNVLSNDTDADLISNPTKENLIITNVTSVSQVGITIINNGKTIQFKPDINLNGLFEFDYTVEDSGLVGSPQVKYSDIGHVKVKVNAKNDTPIANPDSGTTLEDNPVTIDALFNDSDVDQNTTLNLDTNFNPSSEILTILPSGFSGVEFGSVSIIEKKIVYTPKPNFNGIEEFNYTISDTQGSTHTAKVTITVTAVNDLPIAKVKNVSVKEDEFIEVNVVDYQVEKDLDPTLNYPVKDTITITKVDDNLPSHGTVEITDHTIKYTPGLNYNGPDTFKYRVTDKDGNSSIADFNITVNPKNDLPIAKNFTVSTLEDDATTIKVIENPTSIDIDMESSTNTTFPGETLSVTIKTQSIKGTATVVNNEVIFTPNANYNGPATIIYTVTDAAYEFAEGTITVNVSSVNDDPLAKNFTVSTPEDKATTIKVIANPTTIDIDMDSSTNTLDAETLNVAIKTQSNKGIATVVNDEVIFTPNANYNGPATIVYTVTDSANTKPSDGTITLTVSSVNDDPVAKNFKETLDEEGTVTTNVLDNITSVDIDTDTTTNTTVLETLSVSIKTHSVYGTTSIDENKHVIFSPIANYNGTTQITYTVTDSGNRSSDGIIEYTVDALNDKPIANDDSTSVKEDEVLSFNPLVNDVDADLDTNLNHPVNDSIKLILVDAVSAKGGSVIIKDGILEYKPKPNFNGEDSFSYTIEDSGLNGTQTKLTDSATITISVSAVNDNPVAHVDQSEVFEDASIEIDVLGNDTDIDTDSVLNKTPYAVLSVQSVTQGSHGTVTIESNGKVKYTPQVNFNGSDSFSYTVTDEGGKTATATVNVVIKAVNDKPIAESFNSSTDEDKAVSIELISDYVDIDVDYSTVLNKNVDESTTITILGSVNNGVAVLNGNTITFTPKSNFNGSVVIDYRLTDKVGLTSENTITILVGAVNNAPIAFDDVINTDEDESISIDALSNDTDVDLDKGLNVNVTEVLRIKDAVFVGTSNSQVSIVDNKILYTPELNFNGQEKIEYTITDLGGIESIAEVTVTVDPLNDVPVAFDDSTSTQEDTVLSFNPLVNDVDADLDTNLNHPVNDSIKLVLVDAESAKGGSVIIKDGILEYKPKPNFNGEDSFSYTIEDSGLNGTQTKLTDSATITISVSAVNDNPVAHVDQSEVFEDASIEIDVLGNDTDIDTDSVLNKTPYAVLSVQSVTQGSHGTVTIESNGKVKYTPQVNFNGSDSFSYTVTDEGGKTATATVNVVIKAVNDAPIAKAFNVSTDEDKAVTILLIKTDSDIDNNSDLNQNPDDSLSINILSNPVNGILEIVNGSVIYTPNLNFNGVDEFEYELIDQDELSGSGIISINIKAVNDTPQAVNDTYIIDEEEIVILDVLRNDEDVDYDSVLNANVDETQSIREDGFKSIRNGTVAVIESKIQFTPENNYSGIASFIYTLVDKGGLESEATVTLEIKNVNDSPIAIDDLATTYESTSVVIDVLQNDQDIDLDTVKNQVPTEILSIKSVTKALNGSISIVDNKLLYTPNSKWSGVEIVDVVIIDTFKVESKSKLTITVVPVNDLPIAVDDQYVTREDTAIVLNVLGNDVDLDLESSNPLASSEKLSLVSNQSFRSKLGIVTIVGDQLKYTPNENVNGVDIFEYVITDASGAQSVAKVRITIQAVNDIPLSFNVLTPKSNGKYKDGNEVVIKWTEAIEVDNDSVVYDVYYFDGRIWNLLVENLIELNYSYAINNNGETNINAQYKVVAKDDQSSVVAFSEKFIVDNVSPTNVIFTLSCDGNKLTNESCKEIVFVPKSSEDLLDYTFFYQIKGDSSWNKVSSLSEIKIDKPGKHTLIIRVVDEVGNETLIEEIIEIKTPFSALLGSNSNIWMDMLIGLLLLLIILLFTRPIKLIHVYKDMKTGKTKNITKRYFAKIIKKEGVLSIQSNHTYHNQTPVVTYIEIKAWYVKHLKNKHIEYTYMQNVNDKTKVDKDHSGNWNNKYL